MATAPVTSTPTKRPASEMPDKPRKRSRLPPGLVDTTAYAAALADMDQADDAYAAYMAQHALNLKPLRAARSAARYRLKQFELRLEQEREREAWRAQQAEDARQAKIDQQRAAEAALRRGASQHARLSNALQIVKLDIDGKQLEFPEDLTWAETTLRNGGITSVLDVRDRIDAIGGTCACGHKVRDEYCFCKTCDAHVPNPDYCPDPEFAHVDPAEARRTELESVLYGYSGRMGLCDAMTLSQQQIDAHARREV